MPNPSQRWLYGGGCGAFWLLAEFVVFQPNNYDNNKLLYICPSALGCLMLASAIAGGLGQQTVVRSPALRALGLCALLLCRHVRQRADRGTRSW